MGIRETLGNMFGSGEPELTPEEALVRAQLREGYTPPAGTGDLVLGRKEGDQRRIDDITDNGVEDRKPPVAADEADAAGADKPAKPGKISPKERAELDEAREQRAVEAASRRSRIRLSRHASGDDEGVDVAAPRETASVLSGVARDTLRSSSTARLVTGGVVAFVALGTMSTFVGASADTEKCDDLRHMAVGTGNAFGYGVGFADAFGADLNRTWPEVAATVADERGYYVAPEALAMANRKVKQDGQKVVNMDGKTVPAEDLNVEGSGSLCLRLPAPIEPGFASLDGTVTAAEFREQYGLSEERFAKLNPDFAAEPGKTLKAGTVLRYEFNSPAIRGRYVLQIVPDGGLDKVAKGDKKTSKKQLYGLNWPFIEEDGEAPKAGEAAFLPAGKFTVNGKQVSYSQIRKAYR